MAQDGRKVNVSFEEKRADTVLLKVRPHPTSGSIGLRRTNDAPYVPIEVPKPLAEACRELDRRREHGKHISKIGGVDVLGEFALHGIPIEVKAFPKRGTGENAVWAIPRADFRFPAND